MTTHKLKLQKISVELSNYTFDKKPEKHLIGKISNSLKEHYDAKIPEIAQYITAPYSVTWTQSLFTVKRQNEYWQSLPIIGLDFDSGITPEEVQLKLQEYNLISNIIYTTFSDTPEHRKFRVVLCMNTPITDKKDANIVLKNIYKLFGTSIDNSCAEIVRMFYGGRKLLHLDTTLNDTKHILEIMNVEQTTNDNGRTRYCIDPNQIHIPRKDRFECSIKEHEYIQHFNFNEAIKNCKLFNDFVNGIELSYNEIYGLASSCIRIAGGKKYMINIMKKYNKLGKTNYNENKFNVFPSLSKYNYGNDKLLINYSPYKEDHKYHTFIDTDKIRMGEIQRLKEHLPYTIEEVQEKLTVPISSYISKTPQKKITLMKFATGIGKTERLTTLKNVILAFPTNDLKDEVAKKMKHTDFRVTPNYPVFSDVNLQDIMNKFNQNNLFDNATHLIHLVNNSIENEIIIDNISYQITFQDKINAYNYITINKEIQNYTGTILTTHSRVLHIRHFNHNLVIFDEDPLNSIFTIKSLNINYSAFDNTKYKHYVSEIEDIVRNKLNNNYVHEIKFPLPNDFNEFCLFAVKNNASEIIQLIQSDFIMIGNNGYINCAIKNNFPDTNIMIMSATAPISIYKKLFNKINIQDYSYIKSKGKIKQYTRRSFSRTSFEQYNSTVFDEVNSIISDLPVITFKNKKNKFNNSCEDLHFGKCTGIDNLCGKDIAVIGTPNFPTQLYFLYSKLLGLNINVNENGLEKRIVEWNDFKFRFMTFSNPELMEIQLSLIESELIQAVGRSRVLRTEAEVLLFSNLPLQITDEFIY